jgi:hypothetical protein
MGKNPLLENQCRMARGRGTQTQALSDWAGLESSVGGARESGGWVGVPLISGS